MAKRVLNVEVFGMVGRQSPSESDLMQRATPFHGDRTPEIRQRGPIAVDQQPSLMEGEQNGILCSTNRTNRMPLHRFAAGNLMEKAY
jgi:hypothetical protein